MVFKGCRGLAHLACAYALEKLRKKKGYIDSMSDDYALTVIHTCYMCREIPVPSGFLLGAMVIAGSFGSQCSSSHVARFGS